MQLRHTLDRTGTEEYAMESREVRYIAAIAQYKSISKAAEALYISQPSLSKYLKNVETRLGQPLFQRIGMEYIPTYLGERYLHYAQRILDSEQEWNEEFHDILQNGYGRINLCLPIMLSNVVLNQVLPLFYQRYPNIQINLFEEMNFVAERALADPSIDLTIYNLQELPQELDYQILGQEEILLVAPPDHPLTADAQPRPGFGHPWVSLSRFRQEKFVLLYPDQNTGNAAMQLLNSYHMDPDILLRTRNSELTIRLAINGMGITFAPERYCRYLLTAEQQRRCCFSVGRAKPFTNTLVAAYRRQRYLSTHAQGLIHILQEYCSSGR